MPNVNHERLIIQLSEVRPSLTQAFETWRTDPAAQAQFASDPTGYLTQLGPMGDISRSNRLLFALLSNGPFLEWAKQYNNELLASWTGERPWEQMQAERIYDDVLRAMLRYADRELMISLFGDYESINRQIEDVASPMLVGCVFLVLWVAVAVLPVVLLIVEPAELRQVERSQRVNTAYLGRGDLAQLSDALTARLQEVANNLRQSGRLGDPSASLP